MTLATPEPTTCDPPAGDSQLLHRFTVDRDENAFTALVERHGPLVMGVCLRVLSHQQDAEDAFQAAFVVLAKRAKRIRKRDSLAAWLYGVAYRVSVDLARKRQRAERSLVTEPMQTEDPFSQLEFDFDRQVVDEELQRLPVRYRTPLVLYYLGGRTSKEIAEELDVSQGTIDGRLKRGRQQLRLQLTRRGVALSGMLSVVCVSADHAAAAVSPSLVNSTVSIGLGSAGHAPMPTNVSGEILHTAGRELLRMSLIKPLTMTLCFGVLLSVGTVCVNAFDGQSTETGTGTIDSRTGGSGDGGAAIAIAGVQQKSGKQTKGASGGGAGTSAPGGGAGTSTLGGGGGITGGSAGGGLGLGSGGGSLGGLSGSGGLGASGLGEGGGFESMLGGEGEGGAGGGMGLSAGLGAVGPPMTSTEAQMATASATRMSHAKIEAALAKPAQPVTGGDSLQATLDFLSEMHGFPIIADKQALAELAIDPLDDVVVDDNLRLDGLRVANAIELILANTSCDEPLDYILENEVMKITTQDAARAHRVTRVYDMQGLPEDIDPDSLLEVIRKSVNFEEEADVDAQPIGNRLVVRHNRRAHRMIADLLSQLAPTRQGRSPRSRN